MYSTDGQYHSRSRAMGLVKQAIKSGLLTRPDTCELCNKTPIKIKNTPIHAHHWNGYDHPLDVWFSCKSCNGLMIGEQFHNGKVSKEEAREFIRARRSPEPRRPCRYLGCKRMIEKGEYCYLHDPDNPPLICQGITKKGLPCTCPVSGFFSIRFCYRHWWQE